MSDPAFPSPADKDGDGVIRRDAEPGMSFRQYAAVRAMQAMCTGGPWPDERDMAEIARRAWSQADLLLALE